MPALERTKYERCIYELSFIQRFLIPFPLYRGILHLNQPVFVCVCVLSICEIKALQNCSKFKQSVKTTRECDEVNTG